ncbi:MAG: copper chaperone PCu(A)C [Candidatus Polarisedimenticolaceae bacterium]|nr:copper chaperone PCu(A)C [Candidatus Polarisedimenticolaceae bacterium]
MKNYKLTVTLFTMLLLALSQQAFASDIAVSDAYVRAIPPGQTNSAAFMTLHNHNMQSKTLVGVESMVADVVELHEHKHEDGMMKMRRVEGGIEIAPHAMTELKPGGLHVMLIGLKQKLVPGEMIHLTLKFDDNSTQDVHAEVRKLAMKMKKKPAMKMDHNMH